MILSALPDRRKCPPLLDKREFLFGTTALIAWAAVPSKGQVLHTISLPALAAPIITLDPTSDFGVSHSDNISNDPMPSLLVTVDSSVSEGTIVEIFDNGTVYASHKLTAAEISSGVVEETAKSRMDGLHNINAVLISNGNQSSRSNTIGYLLDTSISKPVLSGKPVTNEFVSVAMVTFGAIKPSVGDILELWVDGSFNTKKILGAGDLNSTTIATAALDYGRHDMKCYVYSSDSKKFSVFSDTFSQMLEPANHLTATFNSQVYVSNKYGTAGTTHRFNAADKNQLRIGEGLIVLGLTSGSVNTTGKLTGFTIYIPNQVSPLRTITDPMPLVSQYGLVNGSELASFYGFDNSGSGETACDVVATFDANMDYSSITTWTITGSTSVKAYSNIGDLSANSNQPIPLRGPLSIDVPAGGMVFVQAGSGNGPLAPNWTGVTENCHEQTITANFRPYYFGSVSAYSPGKRIFRIQWNYPAKANLGAAVCGVTFGP